MNLKPIIPVKHNEPFDNPAWLFELNLDGFRGLADTIQGRMLSKNGNRLARFGRPRAQYDLAPGVIDGLVTRRLMLVR